MAFLQLVKINMCIEAMTTLRKNQVLPASEFFWDMHKFILKYDALNEDEKKEFHDFLAR